ncbi:MAG: S8 family serine peptidase, partial [Pirellulaceae bacterium]
MTLEMTGDGEVVTSYALGSELAIEAVGTAGTGTSALMVTVQPSDPSTRYRIEEVPDVSDTWNLKVNGDMGIDLAMTIAPVDLTYTGNWAFTIVDSEVTPAASVDFPSQNELLHAIVGHIGQSLDQVLTGELVQLFETVPIPLADAASSSDGGAEEDPFDTDTFDEPGTFWFDKLLMSFRNIFQNDIDVNNDQLVFHGTGLHYTVGDMLMGSHTLRQELGYTGEGVRIGVISDGADSLASVTDTFFYEITPGKVERNTSISARLGDEGTAMMEIIHDIAPNAQLYFAGVSDTAEYVAALDWFASKNVDIIVDDLADNDEPWFDLRDEVGPILERSREIAAAQDVLFVTAAGNSATQFYQSSANLFEVTPGTSDELGLPPGFYHTFAPAAGSSSPVLFNEVHLPGHSGGSAKIPAADIYLQWTDDFASPSHQFNLVVTRLEPNASGDFVPVASDFIHSDASGAPRRFYSFENLSEHPSILRIAVKMEDAVDATSGAGTEFAIWLTDKDLGFISAGGSLFHKVAAPEYLSVAAVHIDEPAFPAKYSSRGPFYQFVNSTGALEEIPFALDVSAPARVSISGAGGFGKEATSGGEKGIIFDGTSAAAPHVAGVAALLKQMFPDATWQQLQDALSHSARDLTPPPIAVDDVIVADPVLATFIDVLGNDIDVGSHVHDYAVEPLRFPLEIVSVESTPGTKGTLEWTSTGITYLPSSDTVYDEFRYTVEDHNGHHSVGLVTLFFPWFHSIVPQGDSAVVSPGGETTIDVLANDLLLHGAVAEDVTVEPTSLTSALGGVISFGPHPGELRYTPPAGVVDQADFFTYQVSNLATGETVTASVDIEITNHPWTHLVDDVAAIAPLGHAVVIDVLANDVLGAQLELTSVVVDDSGPRLFPDVEPSFAIQADAVSSIDPSARNDADPKRYVEIRAAESLTAPGQYRIDYEAIDPTRPGQVFQGRIELIVDSTLGALPRAHAILLTDLNPVLIQPLHGPNGDHAVPPGSSIAVVTPNGLSVLASQLTNEGQEVTFHPADWMWTLRTSAQEARS